MVNNGFKNWSEAHTFYNLYSEPRKREDDENIINKKEYSWRRYLLNKSPNGELLIKNNFFKELNKEKISLLHINTNLKKIKETGFLYSSGGCLIGSVYCTPLIKKEKDLRFHNLGRYIYEKEIPAVLEKNNKTHKEITPLIIEANLKNETKNNLVGINYLKIGKIHLEIYERLSYLLSNKERNKLEEKVVQSIRRGMDFLCCCNKAFYSSSDFDSEKFFRKLCDSVDHLSILGYFYFEAINEYLFLFDESEQTKKYARRGEFNNYLYKNLMYDIHPELLENFKLSEFRPDKKSLEKLLKKKKSLRAIDPLAFFDYVRKRIIFWVNAFLLSGEEKVIGWRDLEWKYSSLKPSLKPLLGHLIHRELRNFGRYPDFYFYFDQQKALEIWNYWNHQNILVPFNGLIPKGEVGINPAYSATKCRVFTGDVYNRNNDLFIEKKKELDIKIAPKLVDPRHTFMRDKTYFQKND